MPAVRKPSNPSPHLTRIGSRPSAVVGHWDSMGMLVVVVAGKKQS